MTETMAYKGIKFRYADMLNEFRRMKSLAHIFLAPQCEGVLDQCCRTLESIRNSAAGPTHQFEISEEWPIKTADSQGEYRASDKDAGAPVFATLSFRWGIRNPNRGLKRQVEFHLVEEATVSIRIFDAKTTELIAQWQIEAGDAQSPGCHFHAAMNQYGKTGLFPEWLKVPRLPTVLVTPMDGLEFLLGELFQDRWEMTISEDSENMSSWAKGQSNRLERILKWKLEAIRKADTTPWMALKKAKPDLELLTD